MNNDEIELELIQRFGLDKTIMFCEMVSIMFDMMYAHAITYKDEDDVCDYDFDRDWWKDKHNELIKRVSVKSK